MPKLSFGSLYGVRSLDYGLNSFWHPPLLIESCIRHSPASLQPVQMWARGPDLYFLSLSFCLLFSVLAMTFHGCIEEP